MALESIVRTIAHQRWIDPYANWSQRTVGDIFSATGARQQEIRNLLHGVWLHHPLHPVLTDIPLGAWMMAALLDSLEAISGNEDFGPAADAAVGVGIVGALTAAATGFNDWQPLHQEHDHRVGAVHALLNFSATWLYLGSLVLRATGKRSTARTLSSIGLGLVTASAYLGADLIYNRGVGVDHTAGQRLPDEYVPVMAVADLPDAKPMRAQADGVPVVLVRQHGHIYALDDTCAHMGCSLSDGLLEGEMIRCPCHGSQYELANGKVVSGPSVFDQPSFETRVRDGQIEVCGMQQYRT